MHPLQACLLDQQGTDCKTKDRARSVISKRFNALCSALKYVPS